MKKNKPSISTILLVIFTITTFLGAFGYENISNRMLWDSLIFLFLFLAILSWKVDKLVKKK